MKKRERKRSQQQVADQLGLSKDAVGRVERKALAKLRALSKAGMSRQDIEDLVRLR